MLLKLRGRGTSTVTILFTTLGAALMGGTPRIAWSVGLSSPNRNAPPKELPPAALGRTFRPSYEARARIAESRRATICRDAPLRAKETSC